MIGRLSALLLLANVALILGVLWELGQSWSRWTAAPQPLPVAAARVDPTPHLPLAGMPGFSGGPELACRSLEAYLLSLGAALGEASVEPPLTPEAIGALLGGRCSVDEPAVDAALDAYAAAWRRAGLAPHPPLEGR